MHPLLGVALMAGLAQLAAGEDAPFTAPESLSPGIQYCDTLWQAVTGDCNPCESLSNVVAALLPDTHPLACPE